MVDEYDIARVTAEAILLGTDMISTTTIAGAADAAVAGNSYLLVEDASAFAIEGTARFWDGLGDLGVGVDGIDTTATPHRITLKTPLAATHPAGTVLTTNLLPYVPGRIGPYLVKGNPLLFVAPYGSELGYQAMRLVNGPITLQLQVNLLDEQRTQPTVDPEAWSEQQQTRSAAVLRAAITSVLKNPRLTVSSGTYAQGLGEGGKNAFRTTFGPFISRDNIPVFAAATHLVIRPRALPV